MLSITIPGSTTLKLDNLVLDYNGTIAKDGNLISEAKNRIIDLAGKIKIHIITADTHGTVADKTANLPCLLHIIPDEKQDLAKKQFIDLLGPDKTAAIGNGRNDALMLERAALGVGIIQTEGGSSLMICKADVICTNIRDALDLLLKPDRLRATLRN